MLSAAYTSHHTYVCSDSRKMTHLVDPRSNSRAASHSWEHPTRINTVCSDRNNLIFTGSSAGVVQVWDRRMLLQCFSSSTSTVSQHNNNNNSNFISSATTVLQQQQDSATLDSTPAAVLVVPPTATSTDPFLNTTIVSVLPTDTFSSPLLKMGSSPSDSLLVSQHPVTPTTVVQPSGGRLAPSGHGVPTITNNNSTNIRDCVCSTWSNESSISHVLLHGYSDGDDDHHRRFISVSDDNMARIYESSSIMVGSKLQQVVSATSPTATSSANQQQVTGTSSSSSTVHNNNMKFTLRSIVGNLSTRGFPIRAAYWQGHHLPRPSSSSLLEDAEYEGGGGPSSGGIGGRRQNVRLAESDLLLLGGTHNVAAVYDVSDTTRDPVLLQLLEGHKDRVYGCCVHPLMEKPYVATYSADSTVRLWISDVGSKR